MKFSETQKFNIPWVKWLLIVILTGLICLFIYTIVSKTPFGPLIIGSGIILILLILLLLTKSNFRTIYTDECISYQFYPFNLKYKEIKVIDIKTLYQKTIDPIGEFGGYGIRFKKNTKAYILSNKTIYIELKNSKTIVLSIADNEKIQNYINYIKINLT